MDEKQAYRILGLDPPVTQAQAKKAYRTLAKKFHPDRCAGEGTGQAAFQAKMAQINLAFRFLAPRLPKEAALEKKRCRPAPVKGNSKQSVFARFQQFVSSVQRLFRTGATKRSNEDEEVFSSPGSGGKRRKKAPLRFDDILKSCAAQGPGAADSRPETGFGKGKPNSAVFNGYQDYVRRRKQAGRIFGRRAGSSRVEPVTKIDPVTPVAPVTRK
jgi:curved DNA-binding protein CbpA